MKTINDIGGKAFQLTRLSKIGNVPKFFVICDKTKPSDILDMFDEHGFQLVAVRSSATVEDGENASFAGIFDSILNVDKNNLIEAIEKALDSAKSKRVKEYCKSKGISFDTIEMRVIIQEMVDSYVSGVVFTKTSNDTNNIIVEACWGLGDALVGGKITPDNYIVCRKSLKIKRASATNQTTQLNKHGYESVPLSKQSVKKLTNKQILEIAKLSLKIEKYLGFCAADIEWATDKNGKLFILQARPVTGLTDEEYDKFLQLKDNHDWKPIVTRYSTILDRDFYCKGITRSANMKHCGIDYFVGRMFTEKAVYMDMADFTKTRDTSRKLCEQNPNQFHDVAKLSYDCMKRYLEFCKKYRNIDMSTYTDKEMKSLFHEYTERAAEIRSFLPFVTYHDGIILTLLQDELAKHPGAELHNEWIQTKKDLPFVAEHKSMLRIGAEIQKAGLSDINALPLHIENMIDTHIHTYEWLFQLHLTGHPMTRKYTTEVLTELIKTDCADRLSQMEKDYKHRNESIEKIKDISHEMRRLLNICEEYAYLRTYRTDAINEGDFYMRSLLNEISSRLNLSYDDMNCLTADEIIDLLDNKKKTKDLAYTIQARKEYYVMFLVNDEDIHLLGGKKFMPIETQSSDNASALTGKVAQRGRVIGKVKIVWDERDVKKVNKDDIIVAPMTTPDMMVGILKCRGIITDEGGIASHAAQISREFKIPCIMGTGNATKLLQDGDKIEIIADGASGSVKVL